MMPGIVRVGALDGNTIDIELDNGNILLLNMNLLKSAPAFAPLFEGWWLLSPLTDGASVYWQDGPRLTVAEAMQVMCQK